MKTPKIDFVITWVDGSDPVWDMQRQETLRKQGIFVDESLDNSTARYRDWDILKYWFRGVETFAPWVNQIHFITYGHLPKWLKEEHPKLHIVRHEDFIPAEFLPTFSSHPIEWNFHRIEWLTENFVYFNDDMFLIKKVSPEDFFRDERPVDMLALQPDVANADDQIMPYVYLNNAMVLAKYFDKRENMKKQPGAYFHPGYPLMYFGYNLLEMAFPRFTGFYTVHGPSPLKKESYRFFWKNEEELLHRVCAHPFRHKEDISQYVLREYRKLGDLDLYIPEKEAFSRACRILETNGYTEEPENSDHHVTYRFTFPETDRSFTLELHYRIVGIYQFARANELIDEIFSPDHLKPSFVELYGQTYPVLPPTENVFYMLHHMLKHYLYSGFGSRLLCDFTLYLKQYASEIDFEKIHSWCRESKIFHLYELILGSCHLYFGLSASIDPQIRSSAADCAAFLEQILADGDFGSDTERKIVSRGSYRHTGVRAWFHEGHVQMKLRFSRLHKCVLLWPVFWGITFFCFLSNTYRVRHTTLRQTLADFRADNQKTKLLKIFENNDVP